MTLGPADATGRPEGAAAPDNDPSIVPGLADPVPTPRTGPPIGGQRTGPLDMSKDPDRFDPTSSFDPTASASVVGPLDPARDPDRMPRPGEGQSLTDLVGKARAHEDERDNYAWAYGLIGVLIFLGLVAYLFGEVLSP